jgi:hypothetical protein
MVNRRLKLNAMSASLILNVDSDANAPQYITWSNWSILCNTLSSPINTFSQFSFILKKHMTTHGATDSFEYYTAEILEVIFP